MGLFDIRCSLTDISTRWPTRDEWRDSRKQPPKRPWVGQHSMFLVVRDDDRWRPWTPPISGSYDGYGRIQLWPNDRDAYTAWAGDRLWSLYNNGRLTTNCPNDLLRNDLDWTPIESILAHASHTAYSGIDVRIDERPVRACIVRDLFAYAIDEATTSGATSLDEALFSWFGGEESLGAELFIDAPNASFAQWKRYSAMLRYADAHGGLRAIGEVELNANLWSDEVTRDTVRDAWERDEGPIRDEIEALEPQWCAQWRVAGAKALAEEVARQQREQARADGETRPYRPSERYAVGEYIEHKTFGVGRVRTLLSANKIEVQFDDKARTLAHSMG